MDMGFLIQLAPLVLLFAIMYFLLIRPQKKRERAVNTMRNSIKMNDDIVTIGGIYGKVIKVKDDKLTLEVGNDKTRFDIARWSVSSVVNAASEPKKEVSPTEFDADEKPTNRFKKSKVKEVKVAKSEVLAEEIDVIPDDVVDEIPSQEKKEE